MHLRSDKPPRGATMIELLVALSLLAVVLSVAVGLVTGAIQSGTRGRARGELARQGSFLNTLLSNELRMAGFGVPSSVGTHIDDAYAGAGDSIFDSKVILATTTAVGIVADFPRPDAQYATFGFLDNRPAGGTSNVMWHTENNGGCAPDTVSPSCATGTASMFFPGENGCDAVGDAADRTCPWGMKRVRGGERIQIVSGKMRWTHAGVASPLAMSALGAAGPLSLNLSTAWNSAPWPNVGPSDPPVGVTGQGFVTTVDRVFYRLTGTTIERIQCFGDPDPGSVNWPNLVTTAMPATLTSTPTGGTLNECTAAEVVVKNVASLAFAYFNSVGVATTAKDQVTRIDWTIKLRKTVNGRAVEQDVLGTAAVRN